MLFIRVALPFALLDVNSKALTHHMCVKLWTQTSFVLTGVFSQSSVMKPSLRNFRLVQRRCQFSLWQGNYKLRLIEYGSKSVTAGQVNSLTGPWEWLHHFLFCFFKGERCFVLTLSFPPYNDGLISLYFTTPTCCPCSIPFFFVFHNKGNSTYPFSGHGLIVLSCSIRVPAPHSNDFISVNICLGMTLDWKSPKLHLSQCSETKGPLDRLVNGLLRLMSWTGAMA